MPVVGEHHVAVYLVGYQEHTIVATYAYEVSERIGIPLESYGIVGVAYDHHWRPLAAYHFRETVEIHAVVPVIIEFKRIGDYSAAVTLDDGAERVIYRWLYDNTIPRAREEIDT